MPGSLHVLIVEDNADTAQSLALALGLHGAHCEIAETLSEALAVLVGGASRLSSLPAGTTGTASGVNVIVLDLTLPDARGTEAVERLQSLYPEVPMVVLTGSPELRVPAIAAGAQEVLAKANADPDDVLRAAREARVRHQARGIFVSLRQAVDAAVAKVERQIVLSDPDVTLPGGGT